MTHKNITDNKANTNANLETDHSPGTVSSNSTPLAEDWHTLSRTASNLGVGIVWLENFCKKHQLTIRKARNPHYSSASPMRLIELNALKRCFAAEPEALANAQKRSNRARKASVTVAIREKQRVLEAQRRLGEVTQLVESLGPLESSLFWFGQMVHSENRQRFIVGASWELLGGFLASGGKLFQSEKTVFWQFPSGLGVYVPRQLLKNWPWLCLLPHIELAELAVNNDRSESTVTIRRPFGKTETVKTVDSQVAYHRFLEAFGKTDTISPSELNELSACPEDDIWMRFNITTHDAKIWKRFKFTAHQALAYTACGIGVGEARSFAEVGLDIQKDPNVILLWKDDLYRLRDWIFHGMNAQVALQWENVGFSPEEGAVWNELKVSPSNAAVLAGQNIQGFSVHPQQVKELITNLEQIWELKSKRNQIGDHLILLLSIGQSFEDIESVLLRLHSRNFLNRRYLEILTYLLYEQIPISIASDLIMQLPAETSIDAEHILRSAAWLWENRPNMEICTLMAWASSGINVETTLQLIDLGVSVQQAKQYKTLFRRSPKTTKNVLSRIANGEALDDIAKTYRNPKKQKKTQKASRTAWANFFHVNAQLIPPDFGPFDREVVKSFQTGRTPVPEYILKRWSETNQPPRWARSLGISTDT